MKSKRKKGKKVEVFICTKAGMDGYNAVHHFMGEVIFNHRPVKGEKIFVDPVEVTVEKILEDWVEGTTKVIASVWLGYCSNSWYEDTISYIGRKLKDNKRKWKDGTTNGIDPCPICGK